MYYDAQLNYLLSTVGIYLYDHVYHISIKEMSSLPSVVVYQPEPGYCHMKQTEQKLSISVHHFSSPGPVRRSLRDLFSSATLDR